MNIKALAVKDYGPFTNKTVFNFKPGLSVIYGLNQTNGKYSKNSNWVGKSLFFNSLSEILYDEPIVGLKQDKVKAGSRAVILEVDGHEIQIIKTSGKRETIKVIEDGNPIEHLTKTKAIDYIRSKWKISKAEFETFIHLDSRVPHPLVMGSSTERKHFFDDFFKLDRIDYERKLYLSELRKLATDKAIYTELLSSYRRQKAQKVDKKELANLANELKKKKAKRDRLQAQIEQVSRYKELKAIYNSVPKIDIENNSERINKLKKEKQKLINLRSQSDAYANYLKILSRYKQALSSLSKLAKEEEEPKLRKGHQYWIQYNARFSDLQEDLMATIVGQKPVKPERSNKELAECLATVQRLKELIAQAQKFKSGVCPTCGSKVETDNLEDLQSQLEEAEADLERAKKWEKFLKQKENYLAQKAKRESLIEKAKELQNKVNKFEPYSQAFLQRSKLPSKPEKVQKPELDEEQIDERLDQLEEELRSRISVETNIEAIQEYLEWSGPTSFDYDSYNQLNEKIAKLEALVELGKHSEQQLKDSVARLIELKKILEPEEALKSLVEIFSDHQLKKIMVTQISTRLCQLLNKYAAYVFNQDYKFDLVWDTQLQLICTRTVGSQRLVSDVRKLSGAESKLFTLILVLSLLSFMPTDKRPKVMILDEPSANFSTETTQSFIKLLDVLKTVVPCIVIITPKPDVYPNSYPYTIVRTLKGSTIREGLPEECV